MIPSFLCRPLAFVGAACGTLWIRGYEREILDAGRPLLDEEFTLARQAGVKRPDLVRVLIVPEVPYPLHRLLRTLQKWRLAHCFSASGLTAGYGIYIEAVHASSTGLLVHELVHVGQYERLRGIYGFLRQYCLECLRFGYWDAPLEKEARRLSQRPL